MCSRAVTAAVVSCVDGLFQTGVVVHSVWFPVSEAKDSVVVASAVLDSCSWWQSFIPLVSSPSPSSLFLRNRGDWRSNEPSGLGPEYRVVAQAATVALLQALSSQWLSFFVSTLEALNLQPEGLANPSAEGWWPQRGDVIPGPAGLQKASRLALEGRARELVACEWELCSAVALRVRLEAAVVRQLAGRGPGLQSGCVRRSRLRWCLRCVGCSPW